MFVGIVADVCFITQVYSISASVNDASNDAWDENEWITERVDDCDTTYDILIPDSGRSISSHVKTGHT